MAGGQEDGPNDKAIVLPPPDSPNGDIHNKG